MTESAFHEKLAAFREGVTGAACFMDAAGNKHCANNLTKQQADNFAELHGLTLLGWTQGASCNDISC